METLVSNNVNFKFLKKIKIRNLFIYCTLICAFTTYIFQNIFNLGEIVAEGLPLLFGFIYFLIIIKKKLTNKHYTFDILPYYTYFFYPNFNNYE